MELKAFQVSLSQASSQPLGRSPGFSSATSRKRSVASSHVSFRRSSARIGRGSSASAVFSCALNSSGVLQRRQKDMKLAGSTSMGHTQRAPGQPDPYQGAALINMARCSINKGDAVRVKACRASDSTQVTDPSLASADSWTGKGNLEHGSGGGIAGLTGR